MKLYNAAKMHDIDQQAINDFSIPGCLLMENAGRETVRLMQTQIGECENRYALIFIGPGNNGGDGLVIGRHLNQLGCLPIFCFISDPQKLPHDAFINYQIVEKTGLPCFYFYQSDNYAELIDSIHKTYTIGKDCYAIVDAIFGIGLQRDVSGIFEQSINIINKNLFFTNSSQKPPIVSCDIPSGLHADTGNVLGICVKADITVTYSYGKPGLYMNLGSEFAGNIYTLDISIPETITRQYPADATLITPKKVSQLLQTLHRLSDSHKGKNGHTLLVAGSEGMTGAAILAAKGCLRIGTGLVTIARTQKLNIALEKSVPEAMTLPLNSELSYFDENDYQQIVSSSKDKDTILLGPGLGQRNTTANLIRRLYTEVTTPMIIDADAINILAADPESLLNPNGPRIFTPHPGEMSRLLQTSVPIVQQDRLLALQDFLGLFENNQHEIVIVLKGAGSLIATNKEPTNIFLNPTGNKGMATGGMGDVLTGIICGLFCQKISLVDATLLGTYIHGMAGDTLFEEKGIGYTASELSDTVPFCRKELEATIL